MIPQSAFFKEIMVNGYPKSEPALISEIILPKDLKEIGNVAFCEVPLQDITFPPTLEKLGDGALMGCSLRGADVTIPEGVTYIGSWCFNLCYLNKINLPSTLKDLKTGTFCESYFLTEAVMPEGLEIVEDAVFSGCYYLKKMIFPNTVTEIGKDNFRYVNKLEELVFPADMKVINLRIDVSLEHLKRLVLPYKLERIEDFDICIKNLSSLIFPETLTYLNAFSGVPDKINVYSRALIPPVLGTED